MKNKNIIENKQQLNIDLMAEDLILRKEIFTLLKKIKDRKANEEDVLSFSKKIVKKFFPPKHQPDKITKFISNEDKRFAYYSHTLVDGKLQKSIFISQKNSINPTIQSGNILKLVNSLSHEITHLRQHELSALVNKNPELFNRITNDAKQTLSDLDIPSYKISGSDIYKIMQYLKPYINNSVKDLISQDYADIFAFSHYYQLKHEEEARRLGLWGTERILNSLKNDPLCDGETYAYLESQLKDNIKLYIDEEHSKNVSSHNYKLFSENITNLSTESFERLVKDYEELKGNDDVYSTIFLKTMCDVILENKSFDWLQNSLGIAIHLKSKVVTNAICDRIRTDLSITNEDKKLWLASHFDYINDNYVEKTKFTFDNPILSLFDKEQIKSIIEKLANEKKFVFLNHFWKNLNENAFPNYFKDAKDNVLLEQAKENIKDITSFMGDTVRPHMLRLEFNSKNNIMMSTNDLDSLLSILDSVSGLDDISNSIYSNFNFNTVSHEEEIKLYREKYGEMALKELIEEEKIINKQFENNKSQNKEMEI